MNTNAVDDWAADVVGRHILSAGVRLRPDFESRGTAGSHRGAL